MTEASQKPKKKGFFRRVFGVLGWLGKFVRSAINILFLFIFIGLVLSLFGDQVKPLPERAHLRVMPSGVLVEQLTYTSPLNQLIGQGMQQPAETLVSDLTEAIKAAKNDPRITGLVLELDYLAGGGITKLEAVGTALEDFKTSGKPLTAIASSYTQEQYYLATFADEIHLNPMGAVALLGYGAYQSYYREALEKLKVNFHTFKVGEYKDAVEPFTRSGMSEASREHTALWLNELWSAYTQRVETNRKLPGGAVDDFIANMGKALRQAGGSPAELALQRQLVDKLSTPAELRKLLRIQAGPAKADADYQKIDLQEYLFHLRLTPVGQDAIYREKIGVIVAKGTIYDGESPEGAIGSVTLSKLLQKAGRTDGLRALVIRVDSPGGSAFASEVIRGEITQLQQKGIPVVVSMSSLAASGGYWIAAGADKILAAPTTLTGSIGVFGLIPTFEDSLAALGVYSDGVGTSPLADIFHIDRPLSPQAQELIQLSVDNIYDQFLKLVSDGRELDIGSLDPIAQGRVWTGSKALELGLVDQLGSLDDAVAAAADIAGITEYQVETIERQLDFREQLLKQLSKGANQALAPSYSVNSAPPLLNYAQRSLQQLQNSGLWRQDPRRIYLQCWECPLH